MLVSLHQNWRHDFADVVKVLDNITFPDTHAVDVAARAADEDVVGEPSDDVMDILASSYIRDEVVTAVPAA